MVTVERIAGSSAAVEYEVVGVDTDVRGDKSGVTRKVNEAKQARSRVSRCARTGDNHGELLGLLCRTNWVDSADDRAIRVATTDDRCQNNCCRSEPECWSEDPDYRTGGRLDWP